LGKTYKQARNKPVEPPKKPEKAPFFLPSIPSLSGEITFKTSTDASIEGSDDKSSDLSNDAKKNDLSSHFVKLLQKFAEEENCKPS
jgi:U3 small nucleolar RNA-associated protein 21